MRDPRLYLGDIVEAIAAIESFVGDRDFEQFRKDDLVTSAVIRKFEIIGEAAKNVPNHIAVKYRNVPWHKMSGMRDRLIHFYFGVKHELVWSTIEKELPELKRSIQDILKDLETKQ